MCNYSYGSMIRQINPAFLERFKIKLERQDAEAAKKKPLDRFLSWRFPLGVLGGLAFTFSSSSLRFTG